MTTHEPTALAPADYYRLIRGQIEFESTLITQRLNWFLASQSFLVTAYAITLNAPVDGALRNEGVQPRALFHLIPMIALAVCILIYTTIIAAVIAQSHLRKLLAAHLPTHQLQHLPPIQGLTLTRRMGLSAPVGLPVVFAIVWTYLLIRGLSP